MEWEYVRKELNGRIQKKIMELVSELKKDGIIESVRDENVVISRFEYVPSMIIYDNDRYKGLDCKTKKLIEEFNEINEKMAVLRREQTALYQTIDSERLKFLIEDKPLGDYNWFGNASAHGKVELELRISGEERDEFREMVEHPLRTYSEWLSEDIYVFSENKSLSLYGKGNTYHIDFLLDRDVSTKDYIKALEELGIDPDFSDLKNKIRNREKELEGLEAILNKWGQR